jgi:Asp-tRNA(Asn)/Glu-tRNA(Gln) amidotransferase A subunit family amidase
VAAVSSALTALGGAASEAPLPPTELLWPTYRVIQMREALAVHRQVFGTWPAQRDRYAADVGPRLAMAESVTEAEEVRARIAREDIRAAMLGAFASADVIVTPTTGCPPPPVERWDVVDVDGVELAIRDVVMAHTVVANLCGLPVVSVPVGRGSPAEQQRSVQLIGAPGNDGLLLALAKPFTG